MKISLGSGGVRLPGWLHVDADAQWEPDLVADLAQPLPFSDASVDFLQSEDFIGQLSFAQARAHLTDCHRILKPGGVLRLLTPNLAVLIDHYQRGDQRILDLWKRSVGIPLVTDTLGELIHAALTFANQKSFYDETTLRALLEPIGFVVHRVGFNQSTWPELRGLDQRSPENAISLYLDCEKR